MRVVWRKREWVMVAVFAGRHTLGRGIHGEEDGDNG